MDGLVVRSDEVVEQAIDRGERARFRKQVLELPGEWPLGLVRKTLPEGPTRPPVVLVHGFAQNRYTWHLSERSLVNWLAARGWDVYNLELRGHGRSRPDHTMQGERFADYVEDVRRVAQALPQRAFFVGHSLGGAACYAAATEAEMAGVVGLGALFHYGQANWALNALGAASLAAEGLLVGQGLTVRTRALGALIARLYAVSDIAGYAFPISGWWPGSVEPALLEERLVRGFDWTSLRVWLEMSRWAVTGRWDYEEAWTRVQHPLLVLAGDEDHLMPPADARLAYDRSTAPDRTLIVFNHYDHEVHWGHLDLVLGRKAIDHVWPTLDTWMAARR